jgi:hypothetical protein
MITKVKIEYPVSKDEVKSHLRIPVTFKLDDDYIENLLIKSATRFCEHFIDKDIAYTSNVLEEYDFSNIELKVEEGNLISLSNVISDTSTLITSYSLIPSKDFFKIEFTSIISEDPLKVEFITGYNQNKCPEDLKIAVLMECGNQYDSERSSYRFSNIQKTDVVENKLTPYRKIRYHA